MKLSKFFLVLMALFLGAQLWAGEPFESSSQPNPSDANNQNTMTDERPQAQTPSPDVQDQGSSVVQRFDDVKAATEQAMPQNNRQVGEQPDTQTSFLSLDGISRRGN